jgi:iron complex transport system substrate-binding protein
VPEEAFVKRRDRPRRPHPATILIAVVAVALGLALATDYPYSVRDDLGRELTLARAPERIVAMVPSHAELVCALGACGRLVAVDDFSNYPEPVNALPRLGSAFAPDLEALVALEPDLVLVDEYSGLAGPLEALGIPVYAGTAQTLDELFALFGVVGAMLDREDAAALLSGRVRGTLDGVAAVTGAREPVTVYLELDATPYSVGPASFIGDLIARAGGITIVPAELGDFPQLDPEFVVAADPDLIVLADAPFGESLASLRQRPGWAQLGAVRAGAVVELSQAQVDLLNRAGPRVGEAVAMLAALFHPDLLPLVVRP